MKERVTSFDVAERAGVSQSTVSRVFSANSPNVSEEKRDRVIRAARELGYRPNVIARMMRTRRTNIVGIVMANVTSPFYPYVLEMFLQRLQAVERQVLLFTAAPDQSVDDVLPLALQHQVDALVITSATLSSQMVDICAHSRIPVILFNRYINGAAISAVCADNVAGGRLIADALLGGGHTRFAYIAGQANTSTNSDRQQGYMQRLAEYGVQGVPVEAGHYTYDGGHAAMTALLRQDSPPEAVFCANDIMAIGAIDAARALGRRVPGDVSIIGFDDIPMAAWGAYRLTTVSQEVGAMIDATLDLIEAKLADRSLPPELKLIAGQLRIRESARLEPQEASSP